jgi:hypothetical protein
MRPGAGFESVPEIIHSAAATPAPAGAARVIQKPLAFDRLVSIVAEFCSN